MDRFLREQAVFNPEENRWLAKEAKEISSTCRDENPVQIVTHYDLAPNTTSDIELLKRALPTLSEQGIKDVYTDGGYYSPEMTEVGDKLIAHNFRQLTRFF
ncbi:MAG: hypothetical protein IMX04_08240 [Candidatus Carbobacillus altaicus]|nr:hypothetical protein [Candidatus Carbobacillus altaicus]